MTRDISRGEVLGVPVDLVTECHADSDAITVTTSMLLPYFEWDLKRGVLNVWPPPLEPTEPTDDVNAMHASGIKGKDLCMIPARVALALQSDGWYLRSQIPWLKRNCMPESCTDRPSTAVEYVYLLTKSARYYYDKEAVAVPSTMLDEVEQGYNGLAIKDYEAAGVQNPSGVKARIIANARNKIYAPETAGAGTGIPGHSGNYKADGEPLFGVTRNRRNSDWFWESWQGLWDEGGGPLALVVNTNGFSGAHFATFPTGLVKPCVLAGTSAAGCCPKCGDPYVRETEPCGTVRVREGSNTGAADSQETAVGNLGDNSISEVSR